MKKIFSWLFRESLELQKYWWHRAIKVVFLSLFCLSTIGSLIVLSVEPERELMRKHNITIHNTIYQYTDSYSGNDYENTLPKFFEQKGDFGILIDDKIEYTSLSSLGTSVCFKNPEKYLTGIAKVIYPEYLNSLSYEKSKNITLDSFTEDVKKLFYKDTTRRCFFLTLNTHNDSLTKVIKLSDSIVNYSPNIIYYFEMILLVSIVAALSFFVFALVYYRLLLYVVYGNKK